MPLPPGTILCLRCAHRKPFYPETSSVQSTCTNPQAKPFMRDSIFNEYPKRYHPAWVRKCDQFKEKKP